MSKYFFEHNKKLYYFDENTGEAVELIEKPVAHPDSALIKDIVSVVAGKKQCRIIDTVEEG